MNGKLPPRPDAENTVAWRQWVGDVLVGLWCRPCEAHDMRIKRLEYLAVAIVVALMAAGVKVLVFGG